MEKNTQKSFVEFEGLMS